MVKIVIIGGGFAGLAAVKALAGKNTGSEITLIDRKATSDFLPELPGIIGRGIDPRNLSCDLEPLAGKYSFKFVRAAVTAVDTVNRSVLAGDRFEYDYLLIASGSETNFYGQEDIRKLAYKLDDVEDARRILAEIEKGGHGAFVISGGGYTGIEVATAISRYCRKRKLNRRIMIVERGSSILGPLPQKLRDYTISNLREMGISVSLNTTIIGLREKEVSLSSGETVKDAMLIWAAGVKTGDYIQKMAFQKNPQGRLRVDEFLRIDERCYAAGDAADFVYKGDPLRMAVQFSIYEGRLAARNVVHHMRGEPLERYAPRDLGYIVPMANNVSCGVVFGAFVWGRMATFLHYAMCVFRSRTIRNAAGLIADVLK